MVKTFMPTLIFTPEAQYFVTPQIDGELKRQPMLGYFMSSMTGLMARRPLKDQRSIASQVMSKLESRHCRILHKLRPYLFSSEDGLFEGLQGLPAYDDHLVISDLVLPAVNLVVDYDILVALIKRDPSRCTDPNQTLLDAHNDVLQSIKSIRTAERALNSGRLLGDKPDS